jgi:6-phosphogluconolactonase
MQLVHAPVPELKRLLTESFEEAVGGQDQGSGIRDQGSESRRFSCGISGGAPALLFLPALRAAKVEWARITMFWTDERAVPADDPESNYGIAERMLLSPLGAKAPRAIRMPTELPLAQAALKYDAELATELDEGTLDLAILGVGEDGHVCALFAGHPALSQNDRRTVAGEDAPCPPPRRLSLSMRFLLQSQQIWVVAVGPRKLPVLQAALGRTQRETPLDVVLQQSKNVTVFTDQVIRRGHR